MKNKFSWRAFISFGLTYAILIILLSGIMLYVSPPGRYAHWVNWTLWGFSKEGWQAIHTIFSFGFIVLSIFHLLSVNWKAFVSYLKSKSGSGFNKKRELILSSLLVLVLFFGTVLSIPPFKTVMDLGEHFTGSWEKIEERAPVPHAEQLTLTELAHQMDLSSVDEITRKLNIHKIVFENTNEQTLQQIAEQNNTTPIAIYEIISKKAANQMQGSGVGRKTIEDFAAELNKPVDELISILEKNAIKAGPTETLRTIGENNNLPPRDVYKLIAE
ncbi:DUF4405 domain-containing protein [Prolixibacteraceae bacterium Z1-6]|uniref:DUF4405 domain-containing protein n=1 Tax=Draconibacterium aestuarii TaxID=2998507 RepID=A0A9X3FG92_9BACT|nr:DUF4405 domain-containing protein [Prolixibacteraceae bacterium Z1-6]